MRLLYFLLFLIVALSAVDLIGTIFWLKDGGGEANKLALTIYQLWGFWGLSLFKIAGTGLAVGILIWGASRKFLRSAQLAAALCVVSLIIIVAQHYQIRKELGLRNAEGDAQQFSRNKVLPLYSDPLYSNTAFQNQKWAPKGYK